LRISHNSDVHPTDTATAAPADLDRLARLAVEGDADARAQVVEEAMPYLRRWARRYAGRGMDLDDLVQDATVGLLRALERYEPERGVPFLGYARFWVRQSLQQAVAEHLRPVRLPTHVLWDLHDLKDTRERLTRELGRDPRLHELARALDWTPEHVGDVLLAERPGESLDRPIGGGEARLADVIDDPLAGDAYERVLGRLAAEQVRPLLLRLSAREREILALRADGQSLRQIGRRLGVSGERVRALEARALSKLRVAAWAGVDSDGRALPPATDVGKGV